MARVVIVGAGISGLAVAVRLKARRPDWDLVVLEQDSRTGGKVGTVDQNGFRVEIGPNGFLDSKPATRSLCQAVGLGERLIAASEGSRKNRYLVIRGRLQKLPASPLGLLQTRLLSGAAKLRLLTEPLRRRRSPTRDDESVAAFARRRFGPEVAQTFLDALVTGIHAGDPERLSIRSAFPRLAQWEAEHGSVVRGLLVSMRQRAQDARSRGEKPTPARMWSFREGLGLLVDTLTHSCGATIQTGVSVTRIEPVPEGWIVHGDGRDSWPADAVVLACPAREQAQAVDGFDPTLAGELRTIESNRIAVVALGYRQCDVPAYDGFGAIAPQHTRRDILGVQWCSSIFPDRAPPGFVLWRVLCGGTSRPEMVDWPADTLARACHRDLASTMGVRGDPVFRHIVRWDRAIPQYTLGHADRVARIESRVAQWPGLALASNVLHGIALNDVLEQADRVAAEVAREPAKPLTERENPHCPNGSRVG